MSVSWRERFFFAVLGLVLGEGRLLARFVVDFQDSFLEAFARFIGLFVALRLP